jgi:tRNA(fMet)-specific endonuclease VapC
VSIRYFLDTSVCVPVLRGRVSPRRLPASIETGISSVVAAELWAGAHKAGRQQEQLAVVGEFLEIFEVLSFTNEAARHYGEIRAELERKGNSIGPMDLLIAAHARSLGITLITANVGEFKRVKGLKLLAWK